MIYTGTILTIIDNSGTKNAKIIQFKKKKSKFFAGDNVLITLKKSSTKYKLSHKKTYIGLLTHLKQWVIKKDGNYLKYQKNNCLLIDASIKLIANKVLIPCSKAFIVKLLSHKILYKKLITISKYCI